MGATVPRFFLLNIIVALVNSAVAAPIVAFVFGGATGHASDALTAPSRRPVAGCSRRRSHRASSSVLADKIISGFVAVAIIEALPPDLCADSGLPAPAGSGRSCSRLIGTASASPSWCVYILLVATAADAALTDGSDRRAARSASRWRSSRSASLAIVLPLVVDRIPASPTRPALIAGMSVLIGDLRHRARAWCRSASGIEPRPRGRRRRPAR